MKKINVHHIRHLNPMRKIFSELINLTKKWLQVLIMQALRFAFLKNKKQDISVLMYVDMKISKHVQFIYQNKLLKIAWNCYRQRMDVNGIMITSKTCIIKQSINIKSIFA